MGVKFFIMLCFAAIFGVLGCGASLTTAADAQAENTPAFMRFVPLNQVRAKLVFPDLSADEKSGIVDRYRTFVENFYVNKALHEERVGVDVLGLFQDIGRDVAYLTTPVFHQRFQTAVRAQRDFHFRYEFPRPYRCFRSHLPVTLDFAYDATMRRHVVVSSQTPELQEFLPSDELPWLKPGVRVVGYNGRPLDVVLRDASVRSGGANRGSAEIHALRSLHTLNHALDLAPVADGVTLTVESAEGTHSLLLPWVVERSRWCLDDAAHDTGGGDGRLTSSIPIPQTEIVGDRAFQLGSFSTSAGTFAYFRIESFNSWEILSPTEIGSLLAGPLSELSKTTRGMIVDVRGNGGGSPETALAIAQLLAPFRLEPLALKTPATEQNREHFVGRLPAVVGFIDAALQNGREHTEPYSYAVWDETDRLASMPIAAYTKPVTVLAGADCYSACEIFSAALQDHGLAKIVIENHGTTGGGGATVENIEEADLYRTGGYSFQPFGQSLAVAHQQHVRVGRFRGQLIEVYGVRADEVVYRSIADIANGELSYLDYLTRDLSSSKRRQWLNRTCEEASLWACLDGRGGNACFARWCR